MNKDFDAYFKQVTDEVNRIETARQEGVIEGKIEGINEGIIEGINRERKAVTRKLLNAGSTLEQIEEILGFDPRKYL